MKHRPTVLALALFAVFTLLSALAADGGRATSSVELGGATFTVTHGIPSGALPSLPDLSHEHTRRIPDGVVLKTTLPTLWGEVVVPVGEYELVLVVGESQALSFGLAPFGGGNELRVPIERGRYSEPVAKLGVFLMASEVADLHSGALQVRWGSLLLQGNFTVLRKNVQVQGKNRLLTYEFPEDLIPGGRLPLGELQGTGGAPSRTIALVIDGRDRASLELERSDHRRHVAQAATLKRELKSLRRRKRDNDEEDSALDSRIKSLQSRLANLDRSIERNRDTALQAIPAEVSTAAAPTRRVTVTLGEGGAIIVKAPPAQVWTFRVR